MAYDPSIREQAVNEAIAWYYQEREAGRVASNEAFLARYPELQVELTQFLHDHHAFREVAGPGTRADPYAATMASHPPSNGTGSLGTVRYVGDYELLSEIARGGMGVVYRARQVSLNRIVALKMILSGEFASSTDIERFRIEGEAAANLDHANILPIYEVGEHQGRPYFSMKLAEGGSLSEKLQALKANPRAAATLMTSLAAAVHYAHQRGILHRDLKPSNILLDKSGQPLITDFGLAKQVDAGDGVTRTGDILGTPAYMAPEQARADKQLTTAADIYSLGAILYEMITGRAPFKAATTFDTIRQVIEEPAAEPHAVYPPVNRDLAAIAMKCLEKDPAKRYSSAIAMADDLQRWLHHEPTVARPLSFWGTTRRWLQRNAASAIAIILLGLCGGVVGSLSMFAFRGDEQFLVLPERLSWLHPIAWMHGAGNSPTVRWSIIVASLVLVFGAGWLIRWIVQPKTLKAAMVAAGSLALLTTLVTYAILIPCLTSDGISMSKLFQLHPLYHPVVDSEVKTLWPESVKKDEEYVRRYLPAGTSPNEVEHQLTDIRRRIVGTNAIHALMVASSLFLLLIIVIVFTIVMHSTWAVQRLADSGRPLWARIICYLELYPPVLFLLTITIFCGVVAVVKATVNSTGEPPWWVLLLIWLTLVALVVLTHLGVLRQWRWWIRLGIYLLWIGSMAGVFELTRGGW